MTKKLGILFLLLASFVVVLPAAQAATENNTTNVTQNVNNSLTQNRYGSVRHRGRRYNYAVNRRNRTIRVMRGGRSQSFRYRYYYRGGRRYVRLVRI